MKRPWVFACLLVGLTITASAGGEQPVRAQLVLGLPTSMGVPLPVPGQPVPDVLKQRSLAMLPDASRGEPLCFLCSRNISPELLGRLNDGARRSRAVQDGAPTKQALGTLQRPAFS